MKGKQVNIPVPNLGYSESLGVGEEASKNLFHTHTHFYSVATQLNLETAADRLRRVFFSFLHVSKKKGFESTTILYVERSMKTNYLEIWIKTW